MTAPSAPEPLGRLRELRSIAVIPARAGSKRIPDKNIRMFAGRPMISFAIEHAKATGIFQRIVVSTDSPKIAAVAKAWGAEIPFMRPAEIAGDHTPTVDVLFHALEFLRAAGETFDAICCIYPAVPLLNPRFISEAYELLLDHGTRGVASVVKAREAPERALRLNGAAELVLHSPANELTRSQDLASAYYDAGQFYWIKCEELMRSRSLLGCKPKAVVLPELAAHDINTFEDFALAELKYNQLNTVITRMGGRVSNYPPRASHIALGTAQLGLDYGIANSSGLPGRGRSIEVLKNAYISGVRIFDTASAYGSSEEVLGHFFAQNPGIDDKCVITKLAPNLDVKSAEAVDRAICHSLTRLQQKSVWAILLHREIHLDMWQGPLREVLLDYKARGVISNIGISVYDPEYAFRAIQHDDIDILEVPANVFDRRMSRAGIEKAAERAGKTLVVRSIFLQGLALMREAEVPLSISCGRKAVATLSAFCEHHGFSRREFAYDYIRLKFPAAFLLIGAETPLQVITNAKLASRKYIDPKVVEEWDRVWPSDLESLTDPSKWRIHWTALLARKYRSAIRRLIPIE